MPKKKVYLTLILIFVLFFIALNLSFPQYFNRAVNFLNTKYKIQDTRYKIPRFPEIPFKLGLDLQGGSHLLYQADLSQVDPGDYDSAMEGLRDVIERRVNLFGVAEPLLQVQQAGDEYRLIVELPGVKDVAEAISQIGKTPYLEFKEQRSEQETQRILEKQKEIEGKTPEELQEIEDWQLALKDPYFKATSLTGKYLEKAEVNFDPTTNEPLVSLSFDREGAVLFEELTSRNIGKPLAVYIDQVPISIPIVQDVISGGRAQITGDFNIKEAKDLAQNLNAGALVSCIWYLVSCILY